MKRTYGNERTSLYLTPKAAEVYADSDPLVIVEYDTEEGLRYDITGILEADNLTEEEVNEMLEEF